MYNKMIRNNWVGMKRSRNQKFVGHAMSHDELSSVYSQMSTRLSVKGTSDSTFSLCPILFHLYGFKTLAVVNMSIVWCSPKSIWVSICVCVCVVYVSNQQSIIITERKGQMIRAKYRHTFYLPIYLPTQTGMFISLYAQVISCSKQLFEQIIIFSSRTWWRHCFKVVHGKGYTNRNVYFIICPSHQL